MFKKATFTLLIFACALTFTTVDSFGQRPDSGGRFPVYDSLFQEFERLKPSLAKGDLSKDEIASLSTQLQRMQTIVDQLLARQQAAAERSEELIVRMRGLSGDIRLERANLSRRQPADPPKPGTSNEVKFTPSARTYAAGEDVEVIYVVAGRLVNSVWFGLMPASAPHRNIKYSDPIRQFQSQTPTGGVPVPDEFTSSGDAGGAMWGSMVFRSPSNDGTYEIRLFDKTSGTELRSERFEVVSKPKAEFIAELERYRAEIEKGRVAFAKLWEYDNIPKTYSDIFRSLGSKDPERYSKTWSQNGQWFYFVARGRIYTVVFEDAIRSLDRSIRNLKVLGRSYTPEQAADIRQRMNDWRNRSYMLEILMDAYADLIARRQKDLVDLQTAGSPDKMRAAYNERDKERARRLKLISEDINSDLRTPIFPHPLGQPRPD